MRPSCYPKPEMKPIFRLGFAAAGILLQATGAFASAPPNDNFGSPTVLSGLPASANSTNQFATLQTGEPLPVGFETNEQASVWFRWTPASSARVQVRATAGGFDPLVAVWTGTTFSNLQQVGYGMSFEMSSMVPIDAQQGTTYLIAVYSHSGGNQSSFALEISQDNLPRINGTVRAASGNNTLQGIWVTPYRKNGSSSFDYLGFSLTTDSSGNYSIGGLAPGTYKLEFADWTDENYAFGYHGNATFLESAAEIMVPSQAPFPVVNISLQNASQISGRVTGTNGNLPLSGIPIVVRQSSSYTWGWPYWLSKTDAGGNYTVRGLPAGTFRIQFGSDSFGKTSSNFISEFFNDSPEWEAAGNLTLGTAQSLGGINASLATGASISGRITGPDGTTGLGRVEISPQRWEGNQWTSFSHRVQASTDSLGNYTLFGLPPGNYRLEINDPDNIYITEFYNDSTSVESAEDITVGAGETRGGFNASLAIGGRITGRVTGPDGQTGLAGIYVESEGNYWNSTTTDASGNFSLGGFPSGRYKIRFYDSQGIHAQSYFNNVVEWNSADDIEVTAGQTRSGVNASLALAGRITGRVRGPDGQTGLAGISVQAWLKTTSGFWGISPTRTDDSGNFTINGLPAGNYTVQFSDYEGIYALEYFDNQKIRGNATVFSLGANQTRSGIDASLALGSRITGRVTGPSGQSGLAGISVHAMFKTAYGSDWVSSATTDSSGNFTIDGLCAGNYTVEFRDENGIYASEYFDSQSNWGNATEFSLGENQTRSGINASLALGSRISGRVAGPDGTTPLQGIEVKIWWQSGPTSWHGRTASSDAAGIYTLGGLQSGNYLVEFSDPKGIFERQFFDGAADWNSATRFLLAAGEARTEINATMEPS